MSFFVSLPLSLSLSLSLSVIRWRSRWVRLVPTCFERTVPDFGGDRWPSEEGSLFFVDAASGGRFVGVGVVVSVVVVIVVVVETAARKPIGQAIEWGTGWRRRRRGFLSIMNIHLSHSSQRWRHHPRPKPIGRPETQSKQETSKEESIPQKIHRDEKKNSPKKNNQKTTRTRGRNTWATHESNKKTFPIPIPFPSTIIIRSFFFLYLFSFLVRRSQRRPPRSSRSFSKNRRKPLLAVVGRPIADKKKHKKKQQLEWGRRLSTRINGRPPYIPFFSGEIKKRDTHQKNGSYGGPHSRRPYGHQNINRHPVQRKWHREGDYNGFYCSRSSSPPKNEPPSII